MHAFILSRSSQLPAGLSPVDTLEITPETTIGIDEIRSIKSFLARRPLVGRYNTVIIHQAEKMTLPAQQAFLKTLEEPPANSRIYLITSTPDQLIPTILSRVQMPSFAGELQIPLDLDSTVKLLSFWQALSLGERMVYIDTHPFTRQSAIELLDRLEHVLHQDISSNIYHLKSGIYYLIKDTRKYLKANVNPKLALSHFLIHLGS